MFNMAKVFLILSSTLLIFSSQAKNIKLLEVRNTHNGDVFNLVLKVDDQQKAQGLRLYDLKKKSWKTYNLSDLPNGVPLRIESGYEVLILKSQDFEDDRGGHFQLNYLVNALSGNRKNMPLKFDFDGNSWKVFHNGGPVKRLDFMVNRIFGRNIGIETVRAF